MHMSKSDAGVDGMTLCLAHPMHSSFGMHNAKVFPYDLNNDISNDDADRGKGASSSAISAVKREQLDQGAAATIVSGTDGNQQTLVGVLELLECAVNGSMTVQDLIVWFDEHVVRPGYMAPPTRVFEHGVGTVYLGATKTRRQSQEVALRRVLEVARKEVCTVLSGMLENPPNDRFLAFLMVTGRIYNAQVNGKPAWRVRPRPDDRLSGILLTLLGVNILSNQRTYYERMSVCSACGRISFRLDTTNRRRCPAHMGTPETHPLKQAI